MDDTTNVWGWVLGIIVVLLVLAGIWWVASSSYTPSIPNTGTATTSY